MNSTASFLTARRKVAPSVARALLVIPLVALLSQFTVLSNGATWIWIPTIGAIVAYAIFSWADSRTPHFQFTHAGIDHAWFGHIAWQDMEGIERADLAFPESGNGWHLLLLLREPHPVQCAKFLRAILLDGKYWRNSQAGMILYINLSLTDCDPIAVETIARELRARFAPRLIEWSHRDDARTTQLEFEVRCLEHEPDSEIQLDASFSELRRHREAIRDAATYNLTMMLIGFVLLLVLMFFVERL